MNKRTKWFVMTACAGALGGFLSGMTSGKGVVQSLLWAIGLGAALAAIFWLAGAGSRDESGAGLRKD